MVGSKDTGKLCELLVSFKNCCCMVSSPWVIYPGTVGQADVSNQSTFQSVGPHSSMTT